MGNPAGLGPITEVRNRKKLAFLFINHRIKYKSERVFKNISHFTFCDDSEYK